MPTASEAIQFVEGVLDSTLTKSKAQLLQAGGLQMEVALDVRDACMLAMIVAHVGLTVRLSVVYTLKATEFAATQCTRAGCPMLDTDEGCQGNRLSVRQAEGAEAAGGKHEDHYQMMLPHHKTQSRGISMPVIKVVSPKLTTLLNIWQKHGRPLVRSLSHAPPPSRVVLLTKVPAPASKRAGESLQAPSHLPHARRALILDANVSVLSPAWVDRIRAEAALTGQDEASIMNARLLPSLKEEVVIGPTSGGRRRAKQLPWAPTQPGRGQLFADAHGAHITATALLGAIEETLVEGCKESLPAGQQHPLLWPLESKGQLPVCMPALAKGVPGFSQTTQGYVMVELWSRGRLERCRDYAHRLVCWMVKGAPAYPGMQCSHLCARPNCLNPCHLDWVLPETNVGMTAWHAEQGNMGRIYPWLSDEVQHPHERDKDYVRGKMERLPGHTRGKRQRRGRGRPCK